MHRAALAAVALTFAGCGASSTCPRTLPAVGSACAARSGANARPLVCEYGGNANGFCTTTATCVSGAWALSAPEAACGQNGASCPASFTALADGSACPLSASDPGCTYAEGRCGCRSCDLSDGGSGSSWSCRAWSAAGQGCGVPRPPLGAACTGTGFCNWAGGCGVISLGGPDQECVDGTWQPALVANDMCPRPPACAN